jgi:hypothetical protein
MLDGVHLQKVLATWTKTVVHPDTSGAGADSPKRRRRPHWTTAKGYTWEMEVDDFGHDPKSEELGGNRDQVRLREKRRPPAAPHRGRRCPGPKGGPEGDPGRPGGKALLSKGVQKTPERPPYARENTQTAPDPELHLSEDTLSWTRRRQRRRHRPQA